MKYQSARMVVLLIIFCFAGLAAGCIGIGTMANPAESDYSALVAASDRTEADLKTDQRRNPAMLLAFAGVKPGMHVLDLGAGAGYSTELVARAVGPTGRVYGQNPQMFLDQFVKGRFDERLKRPAMSNVIKVVRELDDPVPAEVGNLDMVTAFFVYHDTPWVGTDRARMNRSLFAALKPGGVLVVADHSAQVGAGVGVSKSLHRIEESVVRSELEAAGFRFVADANFLRNPEDKRDTLIFKSPVRVDEFVLKFVKP